MIQYKKYALAAKIQQAAYDLGVDLIGFANIERFANAPLKMSPIGILPTARTVIVCAIHHPDATIELDGQPSAHTTDSYGVQMSMNYKLDRISFRIANLLEELGYPSVPIAASNIWRYKEYKDLSAVFAPDMSHIYAAVAAGLTELGWNGLSISPEYGARNRFVSIITEAEIEPTPLYRGEKLCDMCGECIQHCPMQAYTKEVNGVNNVRIEDKDNKFANKNLWRCAWAEHFALDLDKPIPDIVNEQVIIDTVAREGRRGGTLGTCLKVCVPKALRTQKPLYTKYTTRLNQFMPTGHGVPRKFVDQALLKAVEYGAGRFVVLSYETLQAKGVNLRDMLPDAKTAIVLSHTYRIDGLDGLKGARPGTSPREALARLYREEGVRNINFAAMDIARMFDTVGISAIAQSHKMNLAIASAKLLGEAGADEDFAYSSVILNEALPEMDVAVSGVIKPLANKSDVAAYAKELGFHLFGVASAARVNDVADQLKPHIDGEVVFDAIDKNSLFETFDPDTVETIRPVYHVEDTLPGAKSVIMLGMHYPEAAAQRAGQPPAEAVGPYCFTQFHIYRELTYAAMRLVHSLQEQGYRAVLSHDLLGIGDQTGSPRGLHSAPINNTVEAACAGIGQLTRNRNLYTEQYGIHQRFIAVVTDMPLEADPIKSAGCDSCANCNRCAKACPTAAIACDEPFEISIAGAPATLLPIDRNRCRWASMYALSNKDGFQYNGSELDLPVPDVIDADKLNAALVQRDPINKFRPIIVQSCVIACPLKAKKR